MGLVGSAVGFANKGWAWVGLHLPDSGRHECPVACMRFDNTYGFCDNRRPIGLIHALLSSNLLPECLVPRADSQTVQEALFLHTGLLSKAEESATLQGPGRETGNERR